jgi:hypothetical protein
MVTGVHKTQKIALAFTFVEQYHKDGYEFLRHIIRVTGNETLVSFVSVETRVVKAVTLYTFTKVAEKVLKDVCLP